MRHLPRPLVVFLVVLAGLASAALAGDPAIAATPHLGAQFTGSKPTVRAAPSLKSVTYTGSLTGHITFAGSGVAYNASDYIVLFLNSPDYGATDTYQRASIAANGTFSLSGLNTGYYTVGFGLVFADGTSHVQWYGQTNGADTAASAWYESVTNGAATALSHDFTPMPDTTISGRMSDASGNPVHGYVTMWEAVGNSANLTNVSAWVETGPNGTWALPHMPVGSWRVGFVANSLATPYDTHTGDLGVSDGYKSQWYGNYRYFNQSSPLLVAVDGSTGTVTPLTGINAVMGNSYATPPTPTPLWSGENVAAQNPSERNCECGHGDPVNSATGEFFDSTTDDVIPGVGPTFDVTRHYSSVTAATLGAFGYGWNSLIDAHLTVIDPIGPSGSPLPNSVSVSQENGSTVLFTNQSYQMLPASPRANASLTQLYDGGWLFKRLDNETFTFDSSGNFLSVQDLNGNTITATYTGTQITGLSASGGRAFSLTWSGGHVTQVVDSASRSVNYGYSAGGDLTTVTAVDSKVTSYGYAAGHYITTVTKPGAAVTTNSYDSSNRVVSQTDPIGRVTSFAYDGDTSTITYPSGSKTRDRYYYGQLATQTIGADTASAATTYYSYDSNLNMVSLVDPLGHVEFYSYDGAGNQSSEHDANRSWSKTYDSSNMLTGVTDPMGQGTSLAYDAQENLIKETDPAGHVQSWTRNPDGTAATMTDADGNVTNYGYDAFGRLLSTTDPLGHTTYVTYDAAGHVLTSTDGLGKVTTFTVDAYGRNLTIKDANNHTTTNVYDARGNKTSVTDAKGNVANQAFDLADQLTSKTDALGKITSNSYTPDGYLFKVTDPLSRVTTNAYDVRGNLTSTTDGASHTVSYIYDLNNNRTQSTIPSGAITKTTFNVYNEAIATTDALGKVTQYGRNADGQVTVTTDPLSRSVTQNYFADGRLKSIGYPNSSSENYIYDGRGDLTKFTNADGLVTTYVYDAAKRVTSKTEPGALQTTYTYDNADRLKTVARPSGKTLTYTYDAVGQRTNLHESTTGTVDTSYTYDAVGERTGMTDATGTTSYTYSARGQMLTAASPGGALAYGYDNAGQETSITYPGSKNVTYAFDLAGNMTSVTDWNNKTTSYTWTADNRLASKAGPDGLVETRLYDADDQTLSITTKKGSTQVAKYSYTYDVGRQLTTDTTIDPTTTSLAHTYTYDAISQLKTTKTGTTTLSYTATSGHQMSKTANGDTYTYNTKQQLTNLLPTTGASSSYVYDGDGSRTSSTVAAFGSTPAATTTFAYTPAGSVASVSLPGTSPNTVSYKTDGNGLRGSRTSGSTTTLFLWNVNTQLAQLLSDGSQWYVYGAERSPLAQIDRSSGASLYLHADIIGSVRLITTAAGATAAANTFDPFGKRTVHTGTSDSAFGFAGNWTDSTTGLVYMRARDYDPKTAQFLTVDPALTVTHDPYAYTSNSPLLRTDPSGLWDINDDFLYPALTSGVGGQIANFIVGFGDTASFGLTHVLTSSMYPDVDCKIASSGSYFAGTIAGGVAITAATGGAGGPAVAGLSGVGRAASLFKFTEMVAARAPLANRVAEVHSVLDPIAFEQRTTAVLQTVQGTNVIAGGGRDLSIAQRALAGEGDLLAKADTLHAEQTALLGAQQAGLTPSVMAVSRLICPTCQAAITQAGGSLIPGGLGAVFW